MVKVTCNEAVIQVRPHNQGEKEEKENEAGDEFIVILKQFHGDVGAWIEVLDANRKVTREKLLVWSLSVVGKSFRSA